MASAATSPNPYLGAILLVCTIRTGSGAQILFHYPPHPASEDDGYSNVPPKNNQINNDTSTDSDNSTSDDDDDQFALPNSNKINAYVGLSKTKPVADEGDPTSTNISSHQNGSKSKYSESLFGFAEDGLVSLLSPDRTWHKRKFELSINDLTFVGRPVYVRPDGSWRKGKKRKQQVYDDDPSASETVTDNDGDIETADQSKTKSSDRDQPVITSKSPLTMFHVVFVMNPPPLEHTSRVKDMYDNIIKKFSRALKWEQCHKDYVWKEAELLSAARASAPAERASASGHSAEALSKSSLAVALSTVFTAISSSRIASVTLSPKVKFSLQIPPITSTPSLPSLTDPPIQPGLWLTTATDIGSTGSENEGTENLAKHYTLLLKAPPHRIVKDAMEAGGQVAQTLPKFVSSLRPMKSFYKLSVSSQMSLREIQVLAHHLIYWRRAVAIPPLHQKDVYIVSPNADMRKLRESTKSFEQQFTPSMPNMPSLPKILSILSGPPRTFGSIIPSSDHKDIYYLALAWLMRNGWVTQLRTFVYIRVDPEVKRAVRDSEREVKSQNLIRQKSNRDDIAVGRDIGKRGKRPSVASRQSSDGRRSVDGSWPAHNPRMASLILNPPRASPSESKWLDHIEELLTKEKDSQFALSSDDRAELQKYWPAFTKYFNGHIALETIPVREGLKRKFFWNLLGKIGLNLDHGVEDENGNRAILVPVRHW